MLFMACCKLRRGEFGTEIKLTGGRATAGVVRIGETVHRPIAFLRAYNFGAEGDSLQLVLSAQRKLSKRLFLPNSMGLRWNPLSLAGLRFPRGLVPCNLAPLAHAAPAVDLICMGCRGRC